MHREQVNGKDEPLGVRLGADRRGDGKAADVLLTPGDLAARWQVNVGSLANDRSARRGVPFIKLGGSVRYRLRDVEAFESRCRIATLDAS